MVYRYVQVLVAYRTLWMADRPKITTIVALLIYSSERSSPEYPDISEWRACNKPLGLWNSIWAVKVGFDCVIVFWGYRRERASRAMNTYVFSNRFFPWCLLTHVSYQGCGGWSPASPDPRYQPSWNYAGRHGDSSQRGRRDLKQTDAKQCPQ